MKVTYSADLIKKLVLTSTFNRFADAVKETGNIDYHDLSHVKSHEVPKFMKFIRRLISLTKEYHLDYIKSVEIEVDEVVFMVELIDSSEIEVMS